MLIWSDGSFSSERLLLDLLGEFVVKNFEKYFFFTQIFLFSTGKSNIFSHHLYRPLGVSINSGVVHIDLLQRDENVGRVNVSNLSTTKDTTNKD